MIASFVAVVEIRKCNPGATFCDQSRRWLAGDWNSDKCLFGSITGSTESVENVGLLAVTRTGSRRIIQISSLLMITFSIFGKFGARFASIPTPIVSASYCLFLGYASSAGLGFLQFCNLSSFRTKLMLRFSFFMGLSLPQYFKKHHIISRNGPIQTPAGWFNDTMSVLLMSHATVAGVVALVLDLSLDHDSEHQVVG